MARAQPLARLRSREKYDQQRPEIGDQARLGGRRAAQGGEIERMIAEESADPDEPDRPGLEERGEPAAQGGVNKAATAPNRKCQRRQFEGRNLARRRRQQRQRRPQKNRAKAD